MEKAIAFHGHACPGLAIGVRAATEAIKRLNLSFSEDEEVVCVTENDACGVDGIQAILGCTAGKGNLKFRDTGKMAFSFFNRKNGQKVRMCLKPSQADMSREEKQDFFLKWNLLKKSLLFPNLRFSSRKGKVIYNYHL